jgi:hypothetical protein
MARYRGTVTQSILDWYAGRAQHAQQWFSNAAAQYWAFTLQDNSADFTRLWVYDAAVISSASAFPAGIANPFGNPNATAGYTPQAGTPSSPVFVSSNYSSGNNSTTVGVNAPASQVAGNLLVAVILMDGATAFGFTPPDSSWSPLAAVQGLTGTPGLAAFVRICAGSDPSTYTWTRASGIVQPYQIRIYQFSGVAAAAVTDAASPAVSAAIATNIPAPSVLLTSPGDLIFCTWASNDLGQTFAVAPGFTSLNFQGDQGIRCLDAFTLVTNSGIAGPFVGTQSVAHAWTALTLAFKPLIPGTAPSQSLSGPVQNLTPLVPGILTLNYSPAPLSVGGIVKFLPPGCNYRWSREAPLAIIDPRSQFTLAGIAPEQAAWCDLRWLGIK